MFDVLSRLYEWRNIKRKMALKTQLKNVKMQKFESELPDSSVYPPNPIPNRQGIGESGNRQGIVSESVKYLGETIPNSEPNPRL